MNEVIYRAMRKGKDSLPEKGTSFGELGVRINYDDESKGKSFDIHPDRDGVIYPCNDGMSVTRRIKDLPPPIRPPKFGGFGRLPVFELKMREIPSELEVHATSPTHSVVRPVRECHAQDYLEAIYSTRPNWKESAPNE